MMRDEQMMGLIYEMHDDKLGYFVERGKSDYAKIPYPGPAPVNPGIARNELNPIETIQLDLCKIW